MTHHDLIDCVAELLHERPRELRNAGIDDELNLQDWLSARNLRLVAADPREEPPSRRLPCARRSRGGPAARMPPQSERLVGTPSTGDIPPET